MTLKTTEMETMYDLGPLGCGDTTSHKLMEQDITMVSERVQIQAVVFEVSPVHVRSLQ